MANSMINATFVVLARTLCGRSCFGGYISKIQGNKGFYFIESYEVGDLK